MNQNVQAKAKLQLAIRDWLCDLPECELLFSGRGIDMGDGYLTPDHVALHAATAAYQGVIAAMDYADLAKRRGRQMVDFMIRVCSV